MSAAKICQELTGRGPNTVLSLEAVYDLVGLTAKTGDTIVSQLCGRGVLERLSNDRVRIKSFEQAKMIAGSAPQTQSKPLATTSGIMDPLKATPAQRSPFIVPPALKPRDMPLPETRFRMVDRPFLFDYATLKIGQAFVIDDIPVGYTAKEIATLLRADADRFSKRNDDYHFAIRGFEEKGAMKIGVWRNEKPAIGKVADAAIAKAAAKKSANGKATA